MKLFTIKYSSFGDSMVESTLEFCVELARATWDGLHEPQLIWNGENQIGFRARKDVGIAVYLIGGHRRWCQNQFEGSEFNEALNAAIDVDFNIQIGFEERQECLVTDL